MLRIILVLSCLAWTSSALAAPRVLVTAFEKFAGDPFNASQEMVEALRSELVRQPLSPEGEVHFLILPVVYGKAEELLWETMELISPDAVVAFGQAGSPEFRLETQALNWDGSSVPDNAGQVRRGPIQEGGAEKLFSTLPLQQIAKSIRTHGFSVSLSNSAGDFLCNHLFYQLMRRAYPAYSVRRAGFVHVPGFPFEYWDKPREWGRLNAPAIRAVLETTLKSL